MRINVLFLSICVILEIAGTLLIPEWRGYFYGALTDKDLTTFTHAIYLFLGLMAIMVTSQAFKRYYQAKISQMWRQKQTFELWDRLSPFFTINVDHPEQRVSEDCKISTDLYLRIWLEVIIAGFIVIGLLISAATTPHLGAAAFVYAAVFIGAAYLWKGPMVKRDIEWQISEAAMRKEMTLQITKASDPSPIAGLFSTITEKYFKYIRILTGFEMFKNSKNYLSMLVPLALLGPIYFSGDLSFGDLMKGVATFELIQLNAAVILMLYPDLIRAHAAKKRVNELKENLNVK